jgi:hypothetical protein
MQYNTDPAFAGLERLKTTHSDQIAKFEIWAAHGEWELFHSSHYDWWVFPIHKPSACGLAWTVYDGEVAALKQDTQFIRKYQRGVDLVSASWGWNLLQKAYIPQPASGQSWHHWPVRLFKAALSVQLFGYDELFASLKLYALDLMRQGEEMEFSGHDLSWLFTTGIDPWP